MKRRIIMKKLLSVVLVAVLVLALFAGCNSSQAPESKAPESNAPESQAPESNAPESNEPETAEWPKGAVQLLVPSKAGGITDIYTRFGQEALQNITGGNFATVNYDTEAVAYENLRTADADGSTLLFQHSTIICKYLTGAIDYNPMEEFRVVGSFADMGSQAIIVHPDAPYDTWDEFIEYVKEHPGELNCGISTNGTTHFIFGQVQVNCDVEFNFVECSAEADKLTNVAGGIIDVANCSLKNAKEYETAGKLKVLGVLGSGNPEANYPEWAPITDVIWSSSVFCFAPKSMDDATAQAVNEALCAVGADEGFGENATNIGGVPVVLSLEEVQDNFSNTMSELTEVATSLGINAR